MRKVNRAEQIQSVGTIMTAYFKSAASLFLASVTLGIPGTSTAQEIIGSGIVPGDRANSESRKIQFSSELPSAAAVIVFVDGTDLPQSLGVSRENRDKMAKAIENAKFSGKQGESLDFYSVGGIERIRLVGMAADETSGLQWREAAGEAVQSLGKTKGAIAFVGMPDTQAMADVALGSALGQYRFDRYKSDRKDEDAGSVIVVGAGSADARRLWQSRHKHLAEAVSFARDLVNEPANVIYPESFIAQARARMEGLDGVSIEVLDQADMRRLGMGAIAGVGQGSPRGARLMVITYRGAGGPPIALAGKGITFDSGGISIKSNSGMWEMKGDMSGAAAVTGALLSLAKSRAPVHVVAAVALAENMPGANAQRPGDVVRTLSGKTIEIRSTDAEGRLVLSDAIEYTVAKKKPFALIDIATLTGSVVGALGPEYAGVFARNDSDAEKAIAAGSTTGEQLWRLPMHKAYREAVKSEIADVKNSDTSPAPGASAGAHFIEYFVPEDLPWVHIDMAAVDRANSQLPLVPAGARGFGVMLLDQLARNWRPQ